MIMKMCCGLAVQRLSAESPLLMAKACEAFILELTNCGILMGPIRILSNLLMLQRRLWKRISFNSPMNSINQRNHDGYHNAINFNFVIKEIIYLTKK